jgi:hypothetical protein
MSNPNNEPKLEQNSENSSMGGMQGTIGTGNLQSQGNFNTFLTTVSKINGQTPVIHVYRIIRNLNLRYGLCHKEVYPRVGELYEKDSKFRSLIDAVNAYQKWETCSLKIKRTILIILVAASFLGCFITFSLINKESDFYVHSGSEYFNFLEDRTLGLYGKYHDYFNSLPSIERRGSQSVTYVMLVAIGSIGLISLHSGQDERMSRKIEESLEDYVNEVLFPPKSR